MFKILQFYTVSCKIVWIDVVRLVIRSFFDKFRVGWLVGWLVVGLFLLLPLGAQNIRETLRFTSVSYFKTFDRTP
jgi:hypothetical protein